MKELSIEEKSYVAYKELINRLEDVKNAIKKQNYGIAMDILCNPYPEFQITASTELKESEDKKIRKEMIATFKGAYEGNGVPIPFNSFSKWIAWLEKQGDKDKLIQELGEYKVKYTQEVLEKHLKTINKDDERLRKTTIAFLKDFAEIGYENAVECIDWLEKQGEQKSIDDLTQQEAMDIAVAKCFEQGEQKPDKVEPKFNVGDWIIHNKNTELANSLMLVVDKVSDGYLCKYRDGQRSYNIEFIDKEYRLWTIQDAKEGDVLATNDWVFIFKGVNNNNNISRYCHYDYDEDMQIFNVDTNYYMTTGSPIYPATKEQRDILFQKMKEVGYEWDAEHKQLNKIEQKPAWSEEDEVRINRIVACLENLKVADDDILLKDVDWLKSLRDRVQPKQEWSEEYTRLLDNCISLIENIPETEEEQNWLKFLRLQNKYAYNPYKEVVESIAEICKHYDKASYNGLRDFYNNVKVKCKDAKEYDSLFPQNRWKPSDEQMRQLHKYCPDNMPLTDLYEQLKKLKEE